MLYGFFNATQNSDRFEMARDGDSIEKTQHSLHHSINRKRCFLHEKFEVGLFIYSSWVVHPVHYKLELQKSETFSEVCPLFRQRGLTK
jgi:hypothetical protein